MKKRKADLIPNLKLMDYFTPKAGPRTLSIDYSLINRQIVIKFNHSLNAEFLILFFFNES